MKHRSQSRKAVYINSSVFDQKCECLRSPNIVMASLMSKVLDEQNSITI